MKKKVFRERYNVMPIAKQDEINKKEELVKELGKETLTKVFKSNTKKKKSDK